MKILVVTAVDAEQTAILDAVGSGSGATTAAIVGVGVAEAAARTSMHLARNSYDLVLCAGIGGGFAPLAPGDVAVASSIVFADLGAETPDGFTPVSELGFGRDRYDIEPALAIALADRTGGHLGTIVSVSRVTGTTASADDLSGRFADAVAEGMEGAGVAAAAVAHGIAFAEIRAISNTVGPRDRDAWQVSLALDTLGRAVTAALT